MNRKELMILHATLCHEAIDLMQKKNADYGGDVDPFANFRGSAPLGVHPVLGILVRMGDKMQRLRSFVSKGKLEVSDETWRDSIVDIMNYSVLAAGMLTEEAEHGSQLQGRVQEVPVQPGCEKGPGQPEQGSPPDGEAGPGTEGRREGRGSPERESSPERPSESPCSEQVQEPRKEVKTSITKADIDELLAHSHIESHKLGDKTCVVLVRLPNGFEITESSSCVDPVNYDHALGTKIALGRATDRIWQLEGYVCQNWLALTRMVKRAKQHSDSIRESTAELIPRDPGTFNAHAIERAARAAYQATQVYCHSIGDDSQPDWEDAPTWQKESARAGVRNIIDNPNTQPHESHESWLKQKVGDGWKFGPVKSPLRKEHPCMVPYHQLPEAQRKKDEIFIATVKRVLWGAD